MSFPTMVILVTIAASIIYSSNFEWGLHRFIMHRPFFSFTYPFKSHALTHHKIFKADHTYHLINDEDKWTIPMAWWNGPVLVFLATLPFVAAGFFLHHAISIPVTAFATIGCYYGVYEYIHWCMHLPRGKRRIVESWPVIGWLFYRLNGHHLLHHRYMGKNFNVVCPIADLCLGTLILRAKTHFKQATGPTVPDVQPKFPIMPKLG